MKVQKNILSEIIDKKCAAINATKKPREKKYRAKHEMFTLANYLGVSFWTVWAWYTQKSNPRGVNYFALADYYGYRIDKFYKLVDV